jgi:putative PIN family toxin of toxin-antitoxin system
MKMRVVLDSSVVVSAVRSRHGASNRVLQMAYLRTFQILATPALFLKYEEVLARDEQRAVHQMTAERMSDFLKGLADIIEPVRIYFLWRPQVPDADDEMVLEAALNGRADAIVTHNLRDFASAAAKFRLRVVSPADFVREMAK